MPPEEGGGLVRTSVPGRGPGSAAARPPRRRPGRRGRAMPPCSTDEAAQGRRHLAAIEGLGPFGAKAFERLGELGEADQVALAQRPPVRRVELPRPGQAVVDRRQDLEDVGLLGVDRGALAGERDAGADQVGERQPSRSARAPARGRPPCPARRRRRGRRRTSAPSRRRSGPGPGRARRSARSRRGPGRRRRSRSARSRRRRSWTIMKPPAPKPVSGLSAAKEASTAATAASTALPPPRRIEAPASAVAGGRRRRRPSCGQGRASRGGTRARRCRARRARRSGRRAAGVPRLWSG